MPAEISIIGIDKAIRFLHNTALNMEEITRDAILEVADNIVKDAKDAAPVKTGFMRAMIRVEEDGKDIIVGAFADYSGFVNFGTSKMPARPFLSSAVEMNSRKIHGIWARRVENP